MGLRARLSGYFGVFASVLLKGKTITNYYLHFSYAHSIVRPAAEFSSVTLSQVLAIFRDSKIPYTSVPLVGRSYSERHGAFEHIGKVEKCEIYF